MQMTANMQSTGLSTSEILPSMPTTSSRSKVYVLKKIQMKNVKPKHQLAAIKEA